MSFSFFLPQIKLDKTYVRLDFRLTFFSVVLRGELLGTTDFPLTYLWMMRGCEVNWKGLHHPWHNPVQENPSTWIDWPDKQDDDEFDWTPNTHWNCGPLSRCLIFWLVQWTLINFLSHDFISATWTPSDSTF